MIFPVVRYTDKKILTIHNAAFVMTKRIIMGRNPKMLIRA
jgi:hypothetical protein